VGVGEEHLYDKERLKCKKSRGRGKQKYRRQLKASYVSRDILTKETD